MNSLHQQLNLLDSKVDFLETELTYLNELLIKLGFPQGVITLKETALAMLQSQ